MRTSTCNALLVALCFCATALCAEAHSQQTTRSFFESGYENLAAAAQLVQSSRALATAGDSGATLEQKRFAVSDKAALKALDLLHSWLEMPAQPLPAPESEGIFRILPGVISLGQLLAVRNYVLMADGHVGEAIDSVRDGLRLSYALGSQSTAAWLTGVVIEDMLVKSLTPRLGQLSALDCDRLVRLARDWASSYDALPIALDRARRSKILLLTKSARPENIPNLIQELLQSADTAAIAAEIQNLSPQEIQHTIERSAAAIDTYYGRVQLELATPYWERKQNGGQLPAASNSGDPLVNQIVSIAMPNNFSKSLERYTRIQATARLIGCHAAILRYRWEYDRLPASLTELKMGNMSIDPFTGKQIAYKVDGPGYTLIIEHLAGHTMAD